MWHSMPRANEETLQKLTDEFNSSQSDVKVKLVNQIDYEDTFTKYKAGLSTGDLPDLVQLQETDQQQMIDTQSVLPASVCVKADKYNFSDFLPRVIELLHGRGHAVRDAVQRVGPGPLLQQERVHGGRPRSRTSRRPRSTRCGPRPRSSRRAVSSAPARAQDRARVPRAVARAWPDKLYVNNSNGRKARATKAVFDDATGREIFTWMSDMVKDGLADDEPRHRHQRRSTTCSASAAASHAMTIDTSAALGTIKPVLAAGNVPQRRARRRADARARAGKGGVLRRAAARCSS